MSRRCGRLIWRAEGLAAEMLVVFIEAFMAGYRRRKAELTA